MRKRSAFRFRHERSLHDAVVGQFVIQNQVFRVRTGVPGLRHSCRIRSEIRRPLPCQGSEQFLPSNCGSSRVVAAHKPTRRGTRSKLIDRLLGGCHDPRIAGHSQVIEACITHHLASRDGRRRLADTLFDAKERVLQPGVAVPANRCCKATHSGNWVTSECCGRDRFRRRHWRGRRCRSSRRRLLTRTSTVHVASM